MTAARNRPELLMIMVRHTHRPKIAHFYTDLTWTIYNEYKLCNIIFSHNCFTCFCVKRMNVEYLCMCEFCLLIFCVLQCSYYRIKCKYGMQKKQIKSQVFSPLSYSGNGIVVKNRANQWNNATDIAFYSGLWSTAWIKNQIN